MQKKLKDIQGLEKKFKRWSKRAGLSKGTYNTYWDRIKDFKYFSLQDDSQRKITGRINKQLSSSEEKTAVNRFLQFLFESFEKDQVSDEEFEDLRFKKNAIQTNLELPERVKNKEKTVDVKRHYMPKKELVSLIEEAEPIRAKMFYLLYCGAFRIGELKRLSPAHLRPDYGDYGAVKIMDSRSKTGERTVEFRSSNPLQVFQEVPKGDWSNDENGESWSNVFFSDHSTQLLNYYIRKNCESIGLAPRSSHSFRHIRITDMVNATDIPLEDVQGRVGHDLGSSVTEVYSESSFDRPPQTLEQYLETNDVDIMEKINS